MRAVQDEGVIANLKHYNLYTQEMNRCCGQDARRRRAHDPGDLHAAVGGCGRGGLGSTMCAFNKINADWACENRHLLIDILKSQLGFDGFVLSDFGAAHDTVASVNNGLDMETGLRRTYTPETLLAAINAGRVTVDTINEHVLRILRPMFRFGLFDESSSLRDRRRRSTARPRAKSRRRGSRCSRTATPPCRSAREGRARSPSSAATRTGGCPRAALRM